MTNSFAGSPNSILVIAVILSPWVCSAAKASGHPNTNYTKSPLLQTMYDDVLARLDRRHEEIAQIKTASGWKTRQQNVRTRLEQLFGPFPSVGRAKPPGNVSNGHLAGLNFTVERLLIESEPGYFIPALLWLPNVASSGNQVPGVLYAVGHEGPGFRWNGSDDWQNPGGDQIVQLNLVARNFAVLAFEPIGQGERQMYADLTGGIGKYRSTFEHEYIGRQAFLNGRSAASFWVRDMIRLMDVLEMHPAVDPHRLATAGCSGGGTQAAYHASVDERVSAVSIACYMSTFTVDFAPKGPSSHPTGGGGPADAEQTWPLAFAGSIVLDKPDLLQVRAPLFTQILLTTEDQCFPPQGGQSAYNESLPAFAALASQGHGEDYLWKHEANHYHGYINGNRQQVYKFLMEALRHNSSGLDQTELYNITRTVYDPSLGYDRNIMPSPPYFSYSELETTSTGNVLTAPELNKGLGSRSVHDLVLDMTKANARELQFKRKQPQSFVKSIFAQAPEVAGIKDDNSSIWTTSKQSHSSAVLHGEGHCKIHLTMYPAVSANSSSAIIYVMKPGKAAKLSIEQQEQIKQLTLDGFSVAVPILCGFGIKDEVLDKHTFQYPADVAQGLNRSIVGYQAMDLVRVSRYLKQDLHLHVLGTLAHNQTHSAALHAAVVHGSSMGALACVGNVASYEEYSSSRLYEQKDNYAWIYGILKHYDLPDLIGALAPLPILVTSPMDALHEQLNASRAQAVFTFADAQHSTTKSLDVWTGDLNVSFQVIREWLHRLLKQPLTTDLIV